MREHGRQPITYEVSFHEDYQNIISKLFDEQPAVDGIFASDDIMAAGVITEAKKRGKDVPGQLKVIGYDGTETIQAILPELTTIQQPIELISKTAIEILEKQIEGEFDDLPLETYLPVQLFEGKTT
ncbi:transcriptional regulator [Bacillus sp. JS]|nr:transcriptional regulator [Bacillus sp. JS]GFM15095.1 transcriptional regulator [Bacillus sp. FW1]